jgi:hypothetical protein
VTVYAPSDHTFINIPAEGGRGCGQQHVRPAGADGLPVQPWGIDCPECSAWLLANDNRWSPTVEDIVQTFDEKKAADRFQLRGAAERDALAALALARMAGLSQAEIPAGITRMLSGLPAHVPGVTVCASGHGNTPGSRFCRECGTPMSHPVPAAAITTGAVA